MIQVRVKVPETVLKDQPFLREYQGQTMFISKVIRLRQWIFYYEFEGAVSAKGIPYTFMREWLIAEPLQKPLIERSEE